MNDTEIKITVIGCGTAFSDGGRAQTCFHVQSPEGTFLIDCGASSLASLKQQGFDLNKIDTVLISHFHGDHYGGLPYFLLEGAVFGRREPLTIVSPPGCREKLAVLLELLYPGTEVLEKLDLRFMEFSCPPGDAQRQSPGKEDAGGEDGRSQGSSELAAGYLRLKAFPVSHAPATDPQGLRITTAGKTIAYSGDTCWDKHLIPIAAGADLFICECNFFSTSSVVHLDYQTLTRHLPELEFKQILLTHMGEEMLRQLDQVTLPCAEDGMQITI